MILDPMLVLPPSDRLGSLCNGCTCRRPRSGARRPKSGIRRLKELTTAEVRLS